MPKVTIDGLIERTAGITEEKLDLQCKIEHFQEISSHTGYYLQFANRMGLSDAFKDTIRQDLSLPSNDQKAEEVFKQWRIENGSSATYREFMTICISIKRADVAEMMCKLCAGKQALCDVTVDYIILYACMHACVHVYMHVYACRFDIIIRIS